MVIGMNIVQNHLITLPWMWRGFGNMNRSREIIRGPEVEGLGLSNLLRLGEHRLKWQHFQMTCEHRMMSSMPTSHL